MGTVRGHRILFVNPVGPAGVKNLGAQCLVPFFDVLTHIDDQQLGCV